MIQSLQAREMNLFYIGAFLLILTFSFFPQVLSPTRNDCKDHLDDFAFCAKQEEKCIRESSESNVCVKGYCDCLSKIKANSKDCKNAAENLCKQAKKTHPEKIYTQEKILEETESMVDLKGPVDSIQKTCYRDSQFKMDTKKLAKQMENFTEFTRKKLPTVIVLDNLVKEHNKSTLCKEALTSLLKEGEKLDLVTYSKILVPMNQWRCGWNLGEISQLVLRIPFKIESPNTVIDFNHCCAIHQNCYYMKSTKKDCDEEFISCTKNVVNQKQGEKSGATELQKILVEAHLWDSDTTYNKSNLLDHDYVTYSESIEQEFHKFRHEEKPNYIVTLLEPGHDYAKEVQESVGEIYRRCKSHRFALSSSIYIFLQCNKFSKRSDDHEDQFECFNRFDESVSKIKVVGGECKEAIKNFGKIVGPKIDGWFLITSLIDSPWLRYSAEVIFLIISAAEFAKLVREWIRCCIRFVRQRFYPARRREEGMELEQLVVRNAPL